MTEEEKKIMDKKNNARQSSVPPKANGNDTKKDTGQKKRYQKRRENGSGFCNESGSCRKPVPQKYKNTGDKRPRSRGSCYNQKQGPPLEDVGVEYGSAYQVGSKKGNLNHLLNFSYAPRDGVHRERNADSWSHGGRTGRYSRNSRVHYNKEQFLQATCQFVVKEDGDYSVHFMDPDVLVKWEAVEQVRVSGHEIPSCPICLEIPTVAKMTRCGHIYCWPCILHYLAIGEKTWRKCPICFESVHSQDLKSVATKKTHNYKIGETITMTLMKKEKGSTYAVSMNDWQKRDGRCHNIDDDVNITRHQKLLTASPEQVLKSVSDEKQALWKQLKDAEPSEEAFIDSALVLLQQKEESLTGISKVKEEVSEVVSKFKELGKDASKVEPSSAKVSEFPPLNSTKKIKKYRSAFSDDEEDEGDDDHSQSKAEDPEKSPTSSESVASSENVDTEENKDLQDMSVGDGEHTRVSDPAAPPDDTFTVGSPENPHLRPSMETLPDIMPVEEAAEHLELPVEVEQKNSDRKSSNIFYFYQAADGQHIYIHSVNARCLVREYGSLEHCPQTITATIVEKESVFVTEELRRRLRYLNHLPLTSAFEVAELALRPPVLSKETLKYFSDEIEKRCRLRRKRNREERRWAKHAENEERKQMGLSSHGTIVRSQFVSSGASSQRVSDDTARSDTSSPSLDTPIGSPQGLNINAAEFVPGGSDSVKETADGQQTTCLSFAQMLKAGKQATVWPKAAKQEVVSPVTKPLSPGSEDSDNENRIPVPEYHSSFGDAIEAALHNLENTGEKSNNPDKPPATGGGKKKKKQMVLFSTSMARGGK